MKQSKKEAPSNSVETKRERARKLCMHKWQEDPTESDYLYDKGQSRCELAGVTNSPTDMLLSLWSKAGPNGWRSPGASCAGHSEQEVHMYMYVRGKGRYKHQINRDIYVKPQPQRNHTQCSHVLLSAIFRPHQLNFLFLIHLLTRTECRLVHNKQTKKGLKMGIAELKDDHVMHVIYRKEDVHVMPTNCLISLETVQN